MQSNNWTPDKEHKLLEWQQQARLLSVGHENASDRLTFRGSRTLSAAIIISAIAACADGVALIWTEQYIAFIAIGLLLTAVVTSLNGILQATKPTEGASCQADMAKGYNKIILQIDSMLTKSYDERVAGDIFLTDIESELITLRSSGVNVPQDIWKSIKTLFLNGELDFQKLFTPKNQLLAAKATLRKITTTAAPVVAAIDSINTAIEAAVTVANDAAADDAATDDVATDDAATDDAAIAIPMQRFEIMSSMDPDARKIAQQLLNFQLSRFGT